MSQTSSALGQDQAEQDHPVGECPVYTCEQKAEGTAGKRWKKNMKALKDTFFNKLCFNSVYWKGRREFSRCLEWNDAKQGSQVIRQIAVG